MPYQEFTTVPAQIDADLSDYPLYLDLSDFDKTGNDIFDGATASGGDIRAYDTDGTTQLAREIVSFDTTSKTGEVHVKIPSLSSSVAQTRRLSYDGVSSEPDEDSTYGRENVWNSNYSAIYHLDNATSSTVLDSTANDNDGTKNAANEPVEATGLLSGGVGKCQDFNGSSDYINLGSNSSLDDIFAGGGTFQTIFRADSWGKDGAGRLISKRSADSSKYTIIWLYSSNNTLALDRKFSSGAGWHIQNDITIGNTYYFSLTYNEDSTTNNPSFYLDGVSKTIDYEQPPSGTAQSDAAEDLLIGAGVQGTDWYFDGQIDELRILNTELSSDWISTEYNNQSSPSTFYSVSSESEVLSINLDATLPNIQIEAQVGAYIDVTFSVLQVEAYGGASADIILPELQIDTPEFVYGHLNINLPQLDLEAYEDTSIKLKLGEYPDYTILLPELRIDIEFGERLSLNEKFPTLEINSYGGIRSNDFYLPNLSVYSNITETVIVDPISCTFNSLLPPLFISSESLKGNFYFDLTLPGLIVQASTGTDTSLILNQILSELRIVSSSYCPSLNLDSLLPTIFMSSISYGSDYGSNQSILSESDRFKSVLLRYHRWPT